MAAWESAPALNSLRVKLGDTLTSKFEFRVDTYPTPDGLAKRFFTGRNQLMEGSLLVFVDDREQSQGITANFPQGTFEMADPPAVGAKLQASFYYQWFLDSELEEFLTLAANAFGQSTHVGTTIPDGLRPAVLSIACYHAYMRKAAEFTESVVASAGGFTTDQTKLAPNWRAMADAAMKQAKDEIKFYTDNPLTGAGSVQLAFIAYEMQNPVPSS
jgi:hypothetical protein